MEVVSKSNTLLVSSTTLYSSIITPIPCQDLLYSIYLHWSAVAILAANRLFDGWREFGLRYTPGQSNKITVISVVTTVTSNGLYLIFRFMVFAIYNYMLRTFSCILDVREDQFD